MWCFSRILPLLVGDKVPEYCEQWKCFLLLLTIMDICLAPELDIDVIAYLRDIIHDHHCQFKDLYPHVHITPKLHYLIHYPEWIEK